MASSIDSLVASIDTRAVWLIVNNRPWRGAYSRDALRSARLWVRVHSAISSHLSCCSSQVTRGGIGAGGFDVGAGGSGVVGNAGVGAGAGTGVGEGAGAGAGTGVGAGAEAGAATLGIGAGIGTWISSGGTSG